MTRPAVEVWPGVVRLSGPALVEIYPCLLAGIPTAKRNGRSTDRLEGLRRALHDAMSANGQFEVSKIVEDVALENDWSSGEVAESGTKAAAALAGVTERTMRRWAEAGLGRRVGGAWLVDSSRPAALLQKKRTRHGSS